MGQTEGGCLSSFTSLVILTRVQAWWGDGVANKLLKTNYWASLWSAHMGQKSPDVIFDYSFHFIPKFCLVSPEGTSSSPSFNPHLFLGFFLQ